NPARAERADDLADLDRRQIRVHGFVTFAHFTCQPRFALKDCAEENQSFGALDVGARSTKNGLFLASVTMPEEQLPDQGPALHLPEERRSSDAGGEGGAVSIGSAEPGHDP